jgi:hypothetical protein
VARHLRGVRRLLAKALLANRNRSRRMGGRSNRQPRPNGRSDNAGLNVLEGQIQQEANREGLRKGSASRAVSAKRSQELDIEPAKPGKLQLHGKSRDHSRARKLQRAYRNPRTLRRQLAVSKKTIETNKKHMNETIRKRLGKLRLSGMASTLYLRLQEARGNDLDHLEFLELVLQASSTSASNARSNAG